ncbi:hypothetical protein DPMN_070062 [Dreissena polymorpha]|uniref:Uncharacterized protein n=1 Tax=Dreissena polymorpha TaxID=45954 RepID=A0A9D3Z4E5_DREPO|nr:hypothetical protein DPMN_070062 [Dreissena polymorpha]
MIIVRRWTVDSKHRLKRDRRIGAAAVVAYTSSGRTGRADLGGDMQTGTYMSGILKIPEVS